MLVDKGITSRGKFILILLAEWADEKDEAEVNVIQLADMAKMDGDTVVKALRGLIASGHLIALDDTPFYPDTGYQYQPRFANKPPRLEGSGHEMPRVKFATQARDERARRAYLELLEGAV